MGSVMASALEKAISETIDNQANDAHKPPDSALLYIGAHNVYYVKLDYSFP